MHTSDFPIFQAHPELIYLDSASTTQKPQVVIDEMIHHMTHSYANIHRGAYDLSSESESIFRRSKEKVVDFLHAKNTGEIVYTYNATAAFNFLAQSMLKSGWIEPGDTIILSQIEHHANIVPWQIIAESIDLQVEFIRIGSDGRLDLSDLQSKLTPKVKIISLTGASSVTGEITSIAEIRDMINTTYISSNKPYFVIDGSQRFPHMESNVSELQVDFFIFSGHKVFADTGLGILYGREELLRKLIPISSGGGAINSVSETGYTPAGLPFRHEPGTPHIIGAGSLLAALSYIESIGGYVAIMEEEQKLVEHTLSKIRTSLSFQQGAVELVGPNDSKDRIGVFAFAFRDMHPHDVAEFMAERNIAVRSGHHCTEPLHHALGIRATLRMSLSVYNTSEDIDRFFEVLEESVIALT